MRTVAGLSNHQYFGILSQIATHAPDIEARYVLTLVLVEAVVFQSHNTDKCRHMTRKL